MLLAGFVAPLVIDWNSFRSTFESRAEAVIGQPVRIVGDIDVTLLPTTRVTLRDVEVGDIEGEPMARIERFDMVLDLLPLLSGQYEVREMTVDRPRVVATVDDTGRLDWMLRPEGVSAVDPEDVSLAGVTITDGSLRFFDARTGGAFELSQINTNLFEAGALTGPWRVEGTLVCRADRVCGEALPATFSLASGRRSADGSLRLSAEVTPASADLAGTLTTEGVVRPEGDLLAYAGTFDFDRLALGGALPGEELSSAWTISGDFALDSETLMLTELSWASSDGLYAVTGAAALTLGGGAAFSAELTSRQIDLDRALAADAGGATELDGAVETLWERAKALLPPDLPGRFSLTIPSIIVADSVLQGVTAEIATDEDGWDIEAFSLRLPGQSELAFAGRITPGEEAGFNGSVRLASEQPALLAGWWIGPDASNTALQPFDLSGELAMTEGEARLANARVAIGGDQLNGVLEWRAAVDEASRAVVAVTAETESFAFDQIAALANLVAADQVGALEADYRVRLDAATLDVGGVGAADVVLEGTINPEELGLTQLTIGDLAGARIALDGNWAGFDGDARGTINATLAGDDLEGVVAVLDEFGLGGEVVDWLDRVAPALVPLDAEAVLTASVATGYAYNLALNGTAAGTTFSLEARSNAGPGGWAEADAVLSAEVEAEDVVVLARQAGIDAAALGMLRPATFDLTANGVPADGMTVTLQSTLAGVSVPANGTLTWAGAGTPAFEGTVEVIGDVAPLITLAGLTLPDPDAPAPVVLSADVGADETGIAVSLAPSSVAERSVSGLVRLAGANGERELTGTLNIEELDLGWLMTLPLGARPLPGGDGEPWSAETFTGRMLGGLDVELDLAAERLTVADELTVGNADIGVRLGGEESLLELRSGSLSTGIVTGEAVIEVDNGQALVDGQLFLADVPLDTLVWRRDGQPVAEGVVSLSAEFNALGRSPAALASTLSGTGTIGIRQGVFNFFGAEAFDLVIRLADEGDAMSEEELRSAFTDFLDAGTLAFGDDDIAFDLAAGILTPQPIRKEVDDVRLIIRAPIDLTQLTLDASVEMILFDSRSLEDGPQPRVFVTFAGPIASPDRAVNVAPLAGYLSLRRLRETNQLQAEVLERERFIRILEWTQANFGAGLEAPGLDVDAPPPADAGDPPAPADDNADPPLLVPPG